MAADPLVRPEYHPTLPDLLERRLGVPRRAAYAAAAVVLVVAAIAVVLALRGGDTHYVRRTPPVFNLRWSPDALKRTAPARGWLFALEGRRRGLLVQSLGVRALRLPAYRGAISGMLP